MKLCIDCDNRIEDTEKRCGECIARIESFKKKPKPKAPLRVKKKKPVRNCLICGKKFEARQDGIIIQVYCSRTCARNRYR